ncbi:MAG TPA: ribosome small subunit-dependent GTPase A [Tepidisphaeraceae bacterium]|jgi:ribosome biogenesis GTPase|nr:ribosome small subunit-dependent GTPase A [Tepidisphaeraceae bacterium]
MKGKPKKPPREKDLTSRYLSGNLDEDRVEQQQKFSQRAKHAQQNKTAKTALMRAAEEAGQIDMASLPVGEVVQNYSLFCDVQHDGQIYLCVLRKTLMQVGGAGVIVGDRVRFRATGSTDEQGRPEAVIEEIQPRETLLTRADSFKAIESHPIVANADQMLIVASVAQPAVKWGLVDRMLIAARAGGLLPILCLNKVDLAEGNDSWRDAMTEAEEALRHYEAMSIQTLQTSVTQSRGIDELRDLLAGQVTVLAGHSGVGKSSLIRAVQPDLDLRIGAISGYNEKGRHTTTSARRYPLHVGGAVIDTPGVKLFGLWNVTRENLSEYFPDVAGATAPQWRVESFQRIEASLS